MRGILGPKGRVSGEYLGMSGKVSQLLAGISGKGEVEVQLCQVGGEFEVGSFVGERAGEVDCVADEVCEDGKC